MRDSGQDLDDRVTVDLSPQAVPVRLPRLSQAAARRRAKLAPEAAQTLCDYMKPQRGGCHGWKLMLQARMPAMSSLVADA